jgi:hypothetical protein
MNKNVLRALASIVLCACLVASLNAAPGKGYIADAMGARLLAIDLTTAQTQVVGPYANVDNIGGLAYHSARGILYGVSPSTDSLYSLNLNTGGAALIGSFSASLTMQGAAYDSTSDTLFACDTASDALYRINPDTGSAQLVGPTGIEISGLAVNPLTGALYGTPCPFCSGTSGLYAINKLTGATTLIGGSTTRFNGLAFDSDGTLYGVRNDTDSLYVINTVNGATTLIGAISISGTNALGFEIIPVPEPATLTVALIGLIIVGNGRRMPPKRAR